MGIQKGKGVGQKGSCWDPAGVGQRGATTPPVKVHDISSPTCPNCGSKDISREFTRNGRMTQTIRCHACGHEAKGQEI